MLPIMNPIMPIDTVNMGKSLAIIVILVIGYAIFNVKKIEEFMNLHYGDMFNDKHSNSTSTLTKWVKKSEEVKGKIK